MDIYVQSRGVSQGYRWLKLTNEGQERVDPPLLDKVNVFIDSDAFSLVLGRFNGKLILLVTGLEASQRTDNRTRTIRNSVAWVGEKSDEPVLRTLAIQALQGELRATIDSAVQSGGKEGFEVPFRERPKLTPTGVNGNLQTSKVKKIGNLEQLKTELVKELSQWSLPEGDGIVVVVSGGNKREDFEKNGVWRGLSNLIESENGEWEEVKDFANPDPENFMEVIRSNIKQIRKGMLPVLLIFVLVISLTSNGFLYYKWTKGQNQKRDLEKSVEALKNEKKGLEESLEQINKELEQKREEKQKLYLEFTREQKQLEDLKLIFNREENYLEKIVEALKSKTSLETIK